MGHHGMRRYIGRLLLRVYRIFYLSGEKEHDHLGGVASGAVTSLLQMEHASLVRRPRIGVSRLEPRLSRTRSHANHSVTHQHCPHLKPSEKRSRFFFFL